MLKTFTRLTWVFFCCWLTACAQNQVSRAKPIPEPNVGIPAPTLSAEARQAFEAALYKLKSGDSVGAKAGFERLEGEYPTLAGIKTNLAIIAVQDGLYERALNKAREAQALNPRNPEAYIIEGQTLVLLQDFDLAEQAYATAVTLQPNSAYAHFGLGVVYDLYIQNWALAEKHYEAYLEFADPQRDKEQITQVQNWLKLLERKR